MSRSTGVQPTLRIAVDTGGTFTDCVWLERGRLRLKKLFSTPADPSQAILNAVSQIAPAKFALLHGTTVGTNTLLQRRGARVAFVTTGGFEDILEIGRQNRPKLYDLTFEREPPLVERSMRFGVPERIASDGMVLQKPSREDLRVLARDVHSSGAEAIAVCTLFSFANPENEQAIARVLDELGLPLSVSHTILPEFREYERASTVTVNAYLQPVMQSYLQRLDSAMRQRPRAKSEHSQLFVMQSNGGITSLESAARQPVRTVLSGPAGGVVGAAAMARLSGVERVLTFDMGGTSTDVALVEGEPRPSREAMIAGLPVHVPMLDIHTVGAGGGSLARFDAGRALRVGPDSAGADPGPICYGRGLQPTVTDANLLLGRMQPDRFLGGSFALDLERTRAVTTEWLGKQGLRLSAERFAEGVIRVVNAGMERALRVVSVERGHDPRDFVLVAFGGAGGLHACELARSLGIPRVIVPVMPGALSAYGILVSDVVKDYSRTLILSLSARPPLGSIREQFAALERRARRDFYEERWPGALHMERSVDLRYRGQGYELNVPFTAGFVDEFHRSHEVRYGFSHREWEVELVAVRLRARVKSPRVPVRFVTNSGAAAAKPERRRVWMSTRAVQTGIYEREQLRAKRVLHGPAIVTEYGATIMVPPGARFYIDGVGNLNIENDGRSPKKNGAQVRAPRVSYQRGS
jgi:N-methylhydantoinase A